MAGYGYHRLSDEERKKRDEHILALRHNGVPTATIAERLGLSYEVVHMALKRAHNQVKK